MHRYLVLTLGGLLFSSVLQAETIPKKENRLPQEFIPGRPNTNHPKLPEFVPKKQKPTGFELPPVEGTVIPKNKVATIKILLKGVMFDGNTVVSTEKLQEIAKPFIGVPIFVNQLEELRQKISEYYSEQGYVNSGAILPDQNFKDGIIRFEIIEGKLKEIRVNGTEWLTPDYISDRLQTDPEQPLNITELRQRFQMLLLDPLIERMNASLIPGTQRGESILDINVTRARPYQLMLSTDNYRPPSIGSQQSKISGWVRNLTGFGDVFDGTVIYSEGSLGGSGNFAVPLNAYDTRFHFRFDVNNASVIEEPLNELDIKSEYLAFEFGLTQPLIQTLNRSLSVGLSFNYKKNQTFLMAIGEGVGFSNGASEDGITKDSALRFSLDFTERLEKHVFSARSTTSVGINNAFYESLGRADSDFVAWLGQVQYAGQFFDDGGTLILRGDVQYTDNSLIPMERFSVGGRYSVRGYRENEMVKDRGFVVSAEYRQPLFQDDSDKNFLGKVTVFPFFDYGEAWDRGGKSKNDYLYSVGIGLEWQPVSYFYSEIMYAQALKNQPPKAQYDLQDSGVHWQVTLSAF